jgi:hypothetical protein
MLIPGVTLFKRIKGSVEINDIPDHASVDFDRLWHPAVIDQLHELGRAERYIRRRFLATQPPARSLASFSHHAASVEELSQVRTLQQVITPLPSKNCLRFGPSSTHHPHARSASRPSQLHTDAQDTLATAAL